MSGLRFTIESEIGNVSLVAVALNRICLYLGLDVKSAGEVELCVTEAATNAVRHAYHDETGHTVTIQLEASRNRLQIEVADSGTPMSQELQNMLGSGELTLRTQSDDFHLLNENGRGLRIIHDLMDQVSYERSDNFNSMKMTKNFERAS